MEYGRMGVQEYGGWEKLLFLRQGADFVEIYT